MNGGAAANETPGFTDFDDYSSAGHGTFTNNGPTVLGTYGGGGTLFRNSATASNGTFINNGGTISDQRTGTGGSTFFGDTSTAANGTFINNGGTVSGADGGSTSFSSSSTADNAIITNNGGTASGASGGFTIFEGLFGKTTAGNATIINNGADASGASGGVTKVDGFFFFSTRVFGSSTADNATIISNGANVSGAGGGETIFSSNSSNPLGISTAGYATLIANGGSNGGGGGAIFFEGRSTGGTSRVEVFGNGSLDISAHNTLQRTTIGSIEGDGNVFLGANKLAVCRNDLSTTFSGVIQDGGQNGGIGGSLTKIGSGMLTLSGANTHTGNTNVNRGVLQVDGSIASNTFVNRRGTLAGTGIIHGDVTNRGTISPGSPVGTLTVDNFTQANYADLMIQIANTSDFRVLNVFGTANLGGRLDAVLLNGFVPAVGDSFTFLTAGLLNGTLFMFNRNIEDLTEHWDINYGPTFAMLTVAPGNVPLPDQGSTFLLLMLGLLGLVTYRRQLLRGQS